MSTDATLQIDCTDLAQSLVLAEQIGRNLKGREVIELVSDLGGGKTTFTRGLAAGAGSQDDVSSPTFTLNNIYEAENVTLHHYDFYRLFDPGIMRDELAEVLTDERAVVIVEWADIVEEALPMERIRIAITATGESSRHYEIQAPEKLDYVMQGLRA